MVFARNSLLHIKGMLVQVAAATFQDVVKP